MTQYPDALTAFLVYFHADRDYFECHEIMEEHWKKEPGGRHSSIWLGLIQIAVSLYHERRGNLAGARKMMDAAHKNLDSQPLQEVGLYGPLLLDRIAARRRLLREAQSVSFSDMDLPLLDPELEQACLALCSQRHVTWLSPSQMADTFLLNKHMLRDRSEVIQERAIQLLRKRGDKS